MSSTEIIMAPWTLGVSEALLALNTATNNLKRRKKILSLSLSEGDRSCSYPITREHLARFHRILVSICESIHECDSESFNVFVLHSDAELPLHIKIINDLV